MIRQLSQWIVERTGIDQIWKAIFDRPVPESDGPSAWIYTLGSAALFVLIVQFVTGILLAMNYVPSPDHAYDSVRYIQEQVLFGRLVRGLHHWGSSFMVVLVVLHMLHVYFTGSYKFPREVTWWVGIALLGVILGFSFTGYLLPWDQKAYWATTVGANMAGQTPVVGGVMAKLMKGGDDLGAATLTRFYAVHVLVLPALLIGLLFVHLFLVIWHGISESPERRKRSDRQKPS